jgi:hypothetical protein
MGTLTLYVVILFILFFAFSIGLNLGLYGVISLNGWHQRNAKDHASLIFQNHDIASVPSALVATSTTKPSAVATTATSITTLQLPVPEPPRPVERPLSLEVDIYSFLSSGSEPPLSGLDGPMLDALVTVKSSYMAKPRGVTMDDDIHL